MSDTPIYIEALREAKRRTKRQSLERKRLEDLDRDTDPRRQGAVYDLDRASQFSGGYGAALRAERNRSVLQ